MDNLTDTRIKELNLFKQFKAGQTEVFDYFFERYYQGLCVYAVKLVGSESASKDIVQDFFLRFWENRKNIEIHNSIKSYFIQSVHNRCLDYLSFHNVRSVYLQNQLSLLSNDDLLDYPLLDFELKHQIDKEISRLPEDIRTTFLLSRFEGLSYQQIADQESISVKTVEYRISKALTYLRKALSDYLYQTIF
jgi:RNA polymerase sigma-70 factor (ECF subfamily)